MVLFLLVELGLERERQVEALLKVVLFVYYRLKMVDVPELMYWLLS